MSGNYLQVLRLGSVPYEEGWQMQTEMAAEIAAGKRPPTLLLLQHPHTYTFGRSGHAENLLWDEAELARRGVNVHWVDRGGDVTYHGPGQLVGYPLLPLAPGGLQSYPEQDSIRIPRADYVGYIRKLEIVLMRALLHFGIESQQVEGLTGVWVRLGTGELAKIAAIGVKVDARGISRHGFALNVDPDMSYWDGIIGCGLKGYPVASLSDFLKPPPLMDQVCDAVVSTFTEVFEYQILEEQKRSSMR